jgi:hypothetical protein
MSVVFAGCKKDKVQPAPEPGTSIHAGKLYLNEINGFHSPNADKNFEFYNSTNEPISLANFEVWYFNGTANTLTWTGFPEDVIPAKGRFLIKGANVANRGPNGAGFGTGLSNRNANVTLTLLDAGGDLVDHYQKLEDLRGTPLEFMTHARIPDGGTWYFIPTSYESQGTANPTTPPLGSTQMQPMDLVLRIASVSASSATPAEDADVTITATITDAPSTTITAEVRWSKNDVALAPLPMTLENGVYTATIPGQAGETVVKWQVVASNNKGTTRETEKCTITWRPVSNETEKLLILLANAYGNANNATLGSGLPASAIELYNNSYDAIDFDAENYYLHIGNNTEWTTAIKLTGSVPAKSSFLIVSTNDVSTNRHRANLPVADVTAEFAIDNGSFVIALVKNRATLPAGNPFGNAELANDYVDMLGAGATPFAFEGTKFTDVSRPRVARRSTLTDTDNNAEYFLDIDYRGTPSTSTGIQMPNNDNLYKVWPRSSSMGAWNPMTGLPRIDPTIP